MVLVLSTNTLVGLLSIVEAKPDKPVLEPASVVAVDSHMADGQTVIAEFLSIINLIKFSDLYCHKVNLALLT
jgi:hypothetical protein